MKLVGFGFTGNGGLKGTLPAVNPNPTGPGRWKGLCPIHHEKTPSFYIYSEPWRWYCFGACAGGGDIVDLARELQAGLPGMGHRRRRIPAFEVTL